MKQRNKLTQRGHTTQGAELQGAQQTRSREFTSVEEALRLDAAQTLVPPELTRQIQEATALVSPPGRGWWRQLFGR